MADTSEAPSIALVSDWCQPRQGGIETHLQLLASRLIAAGCDARVLTTFPGADRIGAVPVERLPGVRLPLVELAVSPRLVRTLEERFRTQACDLVHIHASIVAPVCLAGFVAARRLGLPVVVTFHSVMGTLPRLLWLADRYTDWTGGRTVLTGVSRVVAGQVNRAFGREIASVLPNGFDHAFWAQAGGRGRGGSPFHVVSAMRLQARKRPFALLDIFDRARRNCMAQGVEPRLTIAGDGPLRPALEACVAQRGLADVVDFAGWIEAGRLKALYGEADLFVMPSRREAFCIGAIEARAAGLPVLAMSCSGIGQFITDGENGRLAEDDGAMAAILAELATERDKTERLGARQGDLARYDWRQLTEEHLTLYRSLLRRPEEVRSEIRPPARTTSPCGAAALSRRAAIPGPAGQS